MDAGLDVLKKKVGQMKPASSHADGDVWFVRTMKIRSSGGQQIVFAGNGTQPPAPVSYTHLTLPTTPYV